MNVLYIFDNLASTSWIGEDRAKHLLSEVTPIDETLLSKYDCWHCIIDTPEYSSEIGLLYALAAKLGKTIIFEETRVLTPEYWRDICKYAREPRVLEER